MKKKRDDSAFLSLKTTRIMKITAIFIWRVFFKCLQ